MLGWRTSYERKLLRIIAWWLCMTFFLTILILIKTCFVAIGLLTTNIETILLLLYLSIVGAVGARTIDHLLQLICRCFRRDGVLIHWNFIVSLAWCFGAKFIARFYFFGALALFDVACHVVYLVLLLLDLVERIGVAALPWLCHCL